MSATTEQHALLEVVVGRDRDAAAAAAGGADRLLLVGDPEGSGRTPDPVELSSVLRESDLPVRVLLRTERGLDDFNPLIAAGTDLLRLGASGVSFGFLDHDLEIDVDACAEMVRELGRETGAEVVWTFSREFDRALETARSWQRVVGLPGLDAVATGGSSRGLTSGGEDVIALAAAHREVADLVLATGGLAPDQVPWLVRAGVRQFGLGSEARVDGSWTRGSVEASIVRSWRMLLDDALGRALGLEP